MYRIKPPHVITILAGILLFSCSPEACLEETESYLKASFYSSATGKAVRPDSLTLFGTGIEGNRIYSGEKQLLMARMPLNIATGYSSFTIRINTGNDTLQVSFSSSPYLISKECGYSYKHNIEQISYSQNKIVSISIINPLITNEDTENIRIYY